MAIKANSNQLLTSGLKVLADAVQDLAFARDLPSVMAVVRVAARRLTGADGATFVLREGDNCYYADEDAISPLWKGSRFPMSDCISGWVMLNRKAVTIDDIYADSRIPAGAYRPTFVKSLAMVPIRKLDPIGAIGNYWSEYHVPGEDQVAVLQALADITAVTLENISIRNKLEQDVAERTQALARSLEREKELNETKSAFVSMAAHEFRTPLSTILSSVVLAEKYHEQENQEKRERHLGKIRTSVKHLTVLLNDFLSLETLEQGKVIIQNEQIPMTAFLSEISDELAGMRKPGQFINSVHTGPGTVDADKKILRNVLLNLLSNAIKYSEKDVLIASSVDSGGLTISVTDRGIGIPAAQQEMMFGKFFRAGNVGNVQGTGLGLNIVRRYVSLLGGTIGFSSTEGEGSAFTVQLPLQNNS
jgi:signal transduction histidine kinase